MKKDSILKIIGLSALGLLVLWLVNAVLFPTRYGMSVRYNMPGYYSNGYYNYFGINGLIFLIIQVLLVVFILALLLGIVMIVKNSLFTPDNKDSIKQKLFNGSNQLNDDTVVKGSDQKMEEITAEEQNEEIELISAKEPKQKIEEKKVCAECGQELDPEWKICLNCGKEIKKGRKKNKTDH
jgi:hypothetical protein